MNKILGSFSSLILSDVIQSTLPNFALKNWVTSMKVVNCNAEQNNEQEFSLFFFLNIIQCYPIHPTKLCIEELSHLNEGVNQI